MDKCDIGRVSEGAALSIAVLMTVHGRIEATMKVIDALQKSTPSGVRLNFFITDDGSRDLTRETLSDLDSVYLLPGDGSLYWAKGMHLAQNAALAEDFDYHLWVNNDVLLAPDALPKALGVVTDNRLAVGRFSELDGRTTSYGGLCKEGRSPTRLTLQNACSAELVMVDTFNGNFVLIPRRAFEVVGLIEAGYAHAYGDLDYGLRCSRHGFELAVIPGFVGACPRNPTGGTWLDRGLTRRARFSELFSVKGRDLRSQWLYIRRFAGPASAPVFFIASYIKPLLRILGKK